ncbi:MAG: AIR carboxylase family protein [Candidatus Omnitrophica bacterium]|nr:AIR carboxylase family protein [Candidatus Omnitrophota bacterium]
MAKIGIVIGNENDLNLIEDGKKTLDNFGIDYTIKIISGLDSLESVHNFVKEAEEEKIDIIIVCSSIFIQLAGIIASETIIPVIEVPLPSNEISTNELIFSSVQMPEGVPVACMSLGKTGVKNAVIFAIEILSLKDEILREKLREFKSQYV